MIELNLLEKKQPLRLPSVLGLDLNVLNFKMIGLALFIYYIPEIFVHNHFENKIKEEEETLRTITSDSDKITKEIGKNTNIKAQLEAYNKQVEKLKARSAQVDEILKIRTNPKKVLEKIARSIPEDLWFDQLKINENKDVVIIGGSYSPRSIGEFITVINDSPFFANSITPLKQENKQETLDGVVGSYELFELKGKVKNYEMRSR
ncbi:MAG: PilN domain-containing protein [Bacteriovorax sp.]|nr:PilN domain-containing protein [Bacteriovorax sp.]